MHEHSHALQDRKAPDPGVAYDAIVIGSGVGGSMAAHGLVEAGMRVLMLERGPWVERTRSNWKEDAVLEFSPYFSQEGHYVVRGGNSGRKGTYQCVGGPAVFYGGVALRMREEDFEPSPELLGDTGAAWPFDYGTIEPYYAEAERILGVAGRSPEEDDDPTAPWRSRPYPRRSPDFQGPAVRLAAAARSLDLHPSHLPLAIDFESEDGTPGACRQCGTCDGYACAVEAKRDPSVSVIPSLLGRGLTIFTDTVAVRLLRRGRRVDGVVVVNRRSGRRSVLRGDRYILAAGALDSPKLVLASGLEDASPAPDWVGRGLMRHCNGIVFGLFSEALAGSRSFHKQVGILDRYGLGDDRRLGAIQSIHPPPPGVVRYGLPGFMGGVADILQDRCTGLLVMAEDQPRPENRVELSRRESDRFGVPRSIVTHRHTARDVSARRELIAVARAVLREAGARFTKSFLIKTFSHAVGTLRMGEDPATSPLDRDSRFRGMENLWVTDGSFMPRSAAVNPSLTIAANALKAAESIAMSRPSRSVSDSRRTPVSDSYATKRASLDVGAGPRRVSRRSGPQ